MSMYDRSYCNTECIRKNCERNLKYQKPCYRIYTVSDLDSDCENSKHLRCPYFSPIGEEDYDEDE